MNLRLRSVCNYTNKNLSTPLNFSSVFKFDHVTVLVFNYKMVERYFATSTLGLIYANVVYEKLDTGVLGCYSGYASFDEEIIRKLQGEWSLEFFIE